MRMVFAQAMIVARKHRNKKHTPTPTTESRRVVASDLHPYFMRLYLYNYISASVYLYGADKIWLFDDDDDDDDGNNNNNVL